MKSVIFAYVTFAILTAVVFINSYAVSSYLSKIEDKLSEIPTELGYDKEYKEVYAELTRSRRLINLTVSHADLSDIEKDFNELIGHPDGYPWKTGKDVQPIWIYENHLIWGLTAKILLWNFRNGDWKQK